MTFICGLALSSLAAVIDERYRGSKTRSLPYQIISAQPTDTQDKRRLHHRGIQTSNVHTPLTSLLQIINFQHLQTDQASQIPGEVQ